MSEPTFLYDKFEFEESGHQFAFPCCVCIHRHGTDRDEPCRSCINNANAEAPEND